MLVFWLLAALLTVAAVAALLIPMIRARARPADEDQARRLGVLRHRRREIDEERAAGRLGEADAEAAIDVLAGEAAADAATVADTPPAEGARARTPWLLAGVLAVAVPVLAVTGYLHWGTPALVAGLPAPGGQNLTADDLRQALEALNRRVRDQPDDAEAWTLLAQARRIEGDFEGSIQAFAESSRLQPRNARVLAELAETIAASKNGDFSGRPEQLLEQALQISAEEPKALALMGAAQYRLGRPARAVEFLSQLLAGMDPASDQARQIREVAQRIAGEAGLPLPATAAGGPGAAPAIAGPTPGAATASAAGSAPAPASAASSAATPSGAPVVRGQIRLAPALAAQLPPGATLFVSARAAGGPRMPIAASRQPAAALAGGQGLAFSLSDAQALDPQRLLSTASAIVIEARVSASGDAIRQPGDLLGVAPAVAPGATVELFIDQVVK